MLTEAVVKVKKYFGLLGLWLLGFWGVCVSTTDFVSLYLSSLPYYGWGHLVSRLTGYLRHRNNFLLFWEIQKPKQERFQNLSKEFWVYRRVFTWAWNQKNSKGSFPRVIWIPDLSQLFPSQDIKNPSPLTHISCVSTSLPKPYEEQLGGNSFLVFNGSVHF